MPLAHPCVSATKRNGAIIFDPEDLRAPATQQTLEHMFHQNMFKKLTIRFECKKHKTKQLSILDQKIEK